MGDQSESEVDPRESLFGRGEQRAQINRVRFPKRGLLAPDGTRVSRNKLKHVLDKVDERDRGGEGGRGCTQSSQGMADELNIGKATVDRALAVLTRLGFLTHRAHKEGLKTIVERRVCFAAVRAFNAGEPLAAAVAAAVGFPEDEQRQAAEVSIVDDACLWEGEHREREGEHRERQGEHRERAKVSIVDDAQTNLQQQRTTSTTGAASGRWEAVAALLRERGLSLGPALVRKARKAGARADQIEAAIAYFDEHGPRNGWNPAALGWWVSNWSELVEVGDNWPKRKGGRAPGPPDLRAAVKKLEGLPDERLRALVSRVLVGDKFATVRSFAFDLGALREGTVLESLARELWRRKAAEGAGV